jgi:macrodomain Ter protein organizer (MatP/YcbG family)
VEKVVRLNEAQQLLSLKREADDVQAWINDKMAIATSKVGVCLCVRLSVCMSVGGELRQKSVEKAVRLNEAQQLLSFKREADDVQAWINDEMAITTSKVFLFVCVCV